MAQPSRTWSCFVTLGRRACAFPTSRPRLAAVGARCMLIRLRRPRKAFRRSRCRDLETRPLRHDIVAIVLAACRQLVTVRRGRTTCAERTDPGVMAACYGAPVGSRFIEQEIADLRGSLLISPRFHQYASWAERPPAAAWPSATEPAMAMFDRHAERLPTHVGEFAAATLRLARRQGPGGPEGRGAGSRRAGLDLARRPRGRLVQRRGVNLFAS